MPLGRQYLFICFQSKTVLNWISFHLFLTSTSSSTSASFSALPPPPPSLLSRPKSTFQFVEPMGSVFSSGFARGAKSAYTYSFFGGVWTPSFAHVQFFRPGVALHIFRGHHKVLLSGRMRIALHIFPGPPKVLRSGTRIRNIFSFSGPVPVPTLSRLPPLPLPSPRERESSAGPGVW